jgi:hypothetical protein
VLKTRITRALTAGLFTAAACTPPAAGRLRAAVNPCYGRDSYSDAQIAELQSMASATDSLSVRWRRNVHIPTVTPSAVALVSDSDTCVRALAAFNRATRYSDGPATKLYLFNVGNVYVGVNPHFQSGEWVQHIIMDSNFGVLTGYLK